MSAPSYCPPEGCGTDFPNKTTPGLCLRCKNIDEADTDEKKEMYKNMPQCLECGAIGKNIADNQCNTCKRAERDLAKANTASQTKAAAAAARPGAWSLRNGLTTTQNKASSSTTQTLRRGTRLITICIETLNLNTNKPIGWLGSNSRAFPDSTMFADAIMELIQATNTSFETRSATSLTLRDVIVRWHNNMGFHPNSDCGTLGEFYDNHLRLHNSETFLKLPSKFKSTAQPAVALALFIDPVKFKDNHGIDPPPLTDKDLSVAARAKRRLTDFDEPASKRQTISKPLTSQYRPPLNSTVTSLPSCEVNLCLIEMVDPTDGEVMFPGAFGGKENIKGRLFNTPMVSGKDLSVFKLDVDGSLYVAKRLRKICTDTDSFQLNDFIIKETIYWLYRVSQALNAFYVKADRLGFEEEVYGSFAVQPTYLAMEELENTAASVASGVTVDVVKAANQEYEAGEEGEFAPEREPRVLWLIQRYTGMAQDRYNLQKTQNATRNKLEATLSAFTHFFWEEFDAPKFGFLSHYQMASGRTEKGFGKVIFDVVAQNSALTVPRTTDSREEGVHTLQHAHRCNRLCRAFQLQGSAGNGSDDEDD
ncbi:hypothetical protein R3P38DRAFT_3257815 [Favolaschia claudopus]|uniref:Alpha-type protein kinase domain-containing protein n=1 Tax=Favolaschia claudopus TaxID=2862362 RepID=A0AAW0D5U8_9AGAR